METFRSLPEGLKTAFKYVKNIVSYLMKSSVSVEAQKKWVCMYIDIFIEKKITSAKQSIIGFVRTYPSLTESCDGCVRVIRVKR